MEFVAVLTEPLDIAGKSRRIAGNIHDPLGSVSCHSADQFRIAALSGRVEDHHVWALSTLGQHLSCLRSISTEEFSIFYPVEPGVFYSRHHRLWNDLHSKQSFSTVSHGKTDGAGAAIQVQKKFCAGKAGIPSGKAVKPLRLGTVNLIEREGGETEP